MRNLRRYASLIKQLAGVYFSKQTGKDAIYRQTIFYNLCAWGGVYIKFLQILAGMSKFMEGWAGPKEMRVFAQAPREEINLTEYIDLTKFAEISAEPVAAGSFALVFRGKLKTGETVAIKVLRPSIRQNLKKDLATLRRLCGIFTRFLPNYLVDYREAYDACAKMFLLETDYEREMANQAYFLQLYRNHPRVVIPELYPELSTKYVIVQEFIEGPTLADVMSQATPEKPASSLATELTGSDLWEQVILAGGEALCMAMCADFVYGDPHPGNIILLPDNKISFIDFGVVAAKPTSHAAFRDWVQSYYDILNDKGQFERMLETSVTCFCPDLSLAMKQCMFGENNLLDVLTSAMTEKLNHEMSGNTNYVQAFRNGHLIDVFMRVVSTKVITVKVESVNFELLKAIQAFLGSVTILDNSEGQKGFANLMHGSMEYALGRAKLLGVPHDVVNRTSYSLTDSYELVVQTISALADNDEYVFNLVKERIFA